LKLDPRVVKLYPGFIVGYSIVTGITVEKEVEGLEAKKREVLEMVRKKLIAHPIDEMEEIILYRSFLEKMGRKGTASQLEALTKDVERNDIPSHNNLLDSCAIASLEYMILVNAHDLQNVKGELEVTLSSGDKPIQLLDGRKEAPNVNEVILKDQEKIISAYGLGNAKSTGISFKTSNAVLVAWNAPGIKRERVESALKTASIYARKYCGGHVEKTEIL